jgi:mandelate racemase
MVDASRIGGVTGWMRAAALADSQGLPLSSHLIPELSAHLLSVSPTSHWLEYAEWARPILNTPLKVEMGRVLPSDAAGIGLDWNEEAVNRYLVA